MKTKTVVLSAIAVVGVVATTLIGPSYFERRSVRRLIDEGAPLPRLVEVLGAPDNTYSGYNAFRESYAGKVFPSAPVIADGQYCYWAQEGVPYYWVLVISDRSKCTVVAGSIFTP